MESKEGLRLKKLIKVPQRGFLRPPSAGCSCCCKVIILAPTNAGKKGAATRHKTKRKTTAPPLATSPLKPMPALVEAIRKRITFAVSWHPAQGAAGSVRAGRKTRSR